MTELLVAIAALGGSIVGGAVSVGVFLGALKATVKDHAGHLADHEKRIGDLEVEVAVRR